MNFRTMKVRYGKAGMTASLMAILALWATVAIAGMNEDLLIASMFGDLPTVKRLLAKGANVNTKDKITGVTPLMHASTCNLKVVQALLAHGADVNAKSNWGSTALMVTSEAGQRKVVQTLLDKGADVNAKTKGGWTALIYASRYGHREVKEILIKAGAK